MMRTKRPQYRARLHRGDIMSPEKRSAVMARIRGRDTGPERLVAAGFTKLGLTFEGHSPDLPGRPDFVFRNEKLVVFVDGRFWHGWGFESWRNKLAPKWELKIEGNIRRDRRNHRRLRRMGWTVVRFWEHQIEKDLDACVSRAASVLVRSKLSNLADRRTVPGAADSTRV